MFKNNEICLEQDNSDSSIKKKGLNLFLISDSPVVSCLFFLLRLLKYLDDAKERIVIVHVCH